MQKLLFLCTGNSCRSQIAEGFARKYAPPGWVVESAGTEPHGLNPRAVEVMAEKGVDISAYESKSISYERLLQFDVIITLCGDAEETCPMTPPTLKRLHWPFPDPARAAGSREETMAVFRAVRDDIEQAVRNWLEQQSG